MNNEYFIVIVSNWNKCFSFRLQSYYKNCIYANFFCVFQKKAVILQPICDMNEFLEKEEAILKMLKTVFDPEIPVNVYDLGLIYGIELKPSDVSHQSSDEGQICEITMTLTAPSCPAGDFIVEDIRQKVGSVEGVKDVNVQLVFEPEWTKDMMSEEAKLELGFL